MMPAGEHVGARVERLAARVLGAHVAGLALERLASALLSHEIVRARDAEVAELHLALERDEDVRRRHVAVHDAERRAVLVEAAVRVVEALEDVGDDAERELDGQRDLRRSAQRRRSALRSRPSTYSIAM